MPGAAHSHSTIDSFDGSFHSPVEISSKQPSPSSARSERYLGSGNGPILDSSMSDHSSSNEASFAAPNSSDDSDFDSPEAGRGIPKRFGTGGEHVLDEASINSIPLLHREDLSGMRNNPRRALRKPLQNNIANARVNREPVVPRSALSGDENGLAIGTKPSRQLNSHRTGQRKHDAPTDLLQRLSIGDAIVSSRRGSALSANGMKNTRFARAATRPGHGTANALQNSDLKQPPKNQGSISIPRTRLPRQTAPAAAGNSLTRQSFNLPDLPNLTELISEVREKKTLTAGERKTSASRFYMNASQQDSDGGPMGHYVPLERVPLPDEERAIFQSLTALKDRMDHLEHQNVELKATLEDYEQKGEESAMDEDPATQSLHHPKQPVTAADRVPQPVSFHREELHDIESAPSNAVRNYVERAEGNVSRFDSLLKSVTRERDELVMHLDTASAEIKDLRVQAGLLAEQHSAFRSDNAALRDRLDRSVPLNHNEPKHSQQHEKAKRESHLEGQTTQSLGRIESSLAAIDIKLLCAEAENLKARLARAVRQTDRDPQQLKARASKLIDDLTEQTATRSGFSMQVPQPGEADAQSDGIAGSLYAETLSTGGRNRTRTGVSGKVEAESRQKDAEAIAPKTLDNIRESKRVVDGSTRPSGEQRRGLRVERQRSAPRASNELSSSSAKKKPLEDYCDDDGCIEKKAASSMKRNSNNKLSAPSQTRPSEQGLGNIPTDDVTFLSAVDTKDISQIRQSLELERLAARRKRQSTQKAEPKGDNTPSNQEMAREQATGKLASTIRLSHQQPAIEDQAGGEEATNTQQTENGANAYASKAGNAEELTAQSLRSNTSRRRRNVPYETTSAFLLPDITLHIGHAADTSQAAPHTCHDPKCCILCTPNASIPAAVAISSRDDTAGADDAETTMRPATMPVHALRVVLKTATDELAHLELQYTATEAAYAALDPAMGKRKRLSIFDRTMGLLRAIEAKKEMIYNLYDVLEGIEQEQEGSTDHFDAGNDANTQTHQAAHAVKGRKHVTIADMPVTAGKNTEAGYSDEEDLYDELPWDGFVDN